MHSVWRNNVIELIRKNRCRSCVEIGVWKGQLSELILKHTDVERLYLVEPHRYDLLFSVYDDAGTDQEGREQGTYMGEALRSQEDVDRLHDELVRRVAPYGARAQILRMKSDEAAQIIPDASQDFVFVDAIHLYEEVKKDIGAWMPKLKIGGIVAGDDYQEKFKGVIEAVDETFPPHIRHLKPPVWWARKSDYLNQDKWWPARMIHRLRV